MVYVITNRHLAGDGFLKQIEKIAVAQPDYIQLREKDVSPRELYTLARSVREITEQFGVKLIINGSVEVALAIGASGVHLGYQSLSPEIARALLHDGQILGVSVHSAEEALQAESAGADYVIAGHVFATLCKDGIEPRGIDFLRQVCKRVSLPVIAIGGITLENVATVMTTGIAGVAVMSSVMQSNTPNSLIRSYKEQISFTHLKK